MAQAAAVGSIVIPAHNEAAVIGDCLRTLLAGCESGRYETVVVSNGSLDATVAIAHAALSSAPHCSVVELEAPSKIAALRRGDEVATVFPRIYLDADILIAESTLEDLLACLQQHDTPVVAAPSLRVRTAASSRLVRAYYRVWIQLPYVSGGVIGVGIYGVNRAGKEHMGPFPDVLNDDEWVRQRFATHQRLAAPGCFEVEAARTLSALVRQRARVDTGNVDLTRAKFSDGRSTSVSDLVALVRRHPANVLDVAAYLAAVVASRLVSQWRRLRGTSRTWATDETSRR